MKMQEWTLADAEWAMANWEHGLRKMALESEEQGRDGDVFRKTVPLVASKRRALADGIATPQSAFALAQLLVRGLSNRGAYPLVERECRHGEQPDANTDHRARGLCFWCDEPLPANDALVTPFFCATCRSVDHLDHPSI